MVRSWRFEDHGQHVVSRAKLARFVGERGGRGAMWFDRGDAGELFLSPITEELGESTQVLATLPLPYDCAADEYWCGWLSYDVAAHEFAPILRRRSRVAGVGLRRFCGGLFLKSDGTAEFRGEVPWQREFLDWLARVQDSTLPALVWPWSPLRPEWTFDRYRERVESILRSIVAGDTYQVNLSQPFSAQHIDSSSRRPAIQLAAESFALLAETAPAARGAFVDVDGAYAFVSNSPELLFSLQPRMDGSHGISTAPIKGTRPRGSNDAQDFALARDLQMSSKDAAEHLMIVDLLRNDIGRLAIPGTVKAPRTPNLVKLPTVFHLVSEIVAELHPQRTLLEVWRAMAPGGSITGAPKRRTIEIIDELEDAARGIYCGSIFAGSRERFDASIAIRTAEIDASGLYLRSGGGIVLDSDPLDEYRETLHKARAFSRS